MLRTKGCSWFFGLVIMLFAASAFARTGPTVSEIAADWNAMSGGLPAKIVYWDAVNETLNVIDLVSETEITIVSGLVPDPVRPQYDYPTPQWSLDGTRIYYHIPEDAGYAGGGQHPTKHGRQFVVNEDGSQNTQVGTTHFDFVSWYDNDTVVQTSGTGSEHFVDFVDIDANNSEVSRQTVIDWPFDGTRRANVTASGDYVAWEDSQANQPSGGWNRSLVHRISTSEETEVITRDDDACTIALKQDGSGTCIYNHYVHTEAEIKAFDPPGIGGGTLLLVVPGGITPVGELYYMRWSNHPDYIAYMGHPSLASTPAADNDGYVIQLSDLSVGNYVFLGNGVWTPDIWVDTGGGPDTTPPDVSVASVVINGTASDAELNPPVVTVAGISLGQVASFSQEVTLTGSTITVTADDTANTTTINLDVTVP